MQPVTLYGIANCDTIRRARRWLEREGIAYEFHDYREHGLEVELLESLAAELGWETMLNRRGTTWRRLPAATREGIDRDAALALMRDNPALIRRPILGLGSRHRVGFDESEYEELLRHHA